jgi:hypothetical protein
VAEAAFDAELPEFCVLGRLDLLPSLAAQDADEAAYSVRLPISGFHDLAQRSAFGSLHHRDHFGLLVGATPFDLPAALARAGFFAELVFLTGLRSSQSSRGLGEIASRIFSA